MEPGKETIDDTVEHLIAKLREALAIQEREKHGSHKAEPDHPPDHPAPVRPATEPPVTPASAVPVTPAPDVPATEPPRPATEPPLTEKVPEPDKPLVVEKSGGNSTRARRVIIVTKGRDGKSVKNVFRSVNAAAKFMRVARSTLAYRLETGSDPTAYYEGSDMPEGFAAVRDQALRVFSTGTPDECFAWMHAVMKTFTRRQDEDEAGPSGT